MRVGRGKKQIALKNDVRYASTGNDRDKQGSRTYCHKCGQILMGRDWYVLSNWKLTARGSCPSCGTRCAGVLECLPGTWGAQCVPVRLRDYHDNIV